MYVTDTTSSTFSLLSKDINILIKKKKHCTNEVVCDVNDIGSHVGYSKH